MHDLVLSPTQWQSLLSARLGGRSVPQRRGALRLIEWAIHAAPLLPLLRASMPLPDEALPEAGEGLIAIRPFQSAIRLDTILELRASSQVPAGIRTIAEQYLRSLPGYESGSLQDVQLSDATSEAHGAIMMHLSRNIWDLAEGPAPFSD